MKKTFFVLFIILFPIISYTQWTNLLTSIPGDLNRVHFKDTNIGLVVGDSGVFKTINGGSSWNKQVLNNNPSDSLHFENTKFNSAYYYNGFWYVVGRLRTNGNGVIFRDSSSNWKLSYLSLNKSVNDISEVNSILTAVGDSGLIVFTSNNGNLWSFGYAGGITDHLYSVNENNGNANIGGQNQVLRERSGSPQSWYSLSGQSVKQLIALNSGHPKGVSSLNILEGFGLNNRNTNYNGFILPTSIDFIGFQAEACVGTTNGILRSKDNFKYWEKVVSSSGYHINDLHFLNGGNFGYAVGKNGLVLKTRNAGGDALPLILLSQSNGACKDSLVTFVNDTLSGYSYSWKFNGINFSPDNNSLLDTSFNSIGSYTLRLIGNNGMFKDSVERTFQVVNLPDTNKTVTLSDSLLCKIGNSDVIIHNSQLNTRYQLIRLPDYSVIATGIGNNDSLILNTGTITDSTFYLINAKSTLADCDKYFPDTVLVGVEKTKADFHSVFINAELNEGIKMFNNSRQASFFDWDFGISSSIPTSTNFEETISYNVLGQTQTTLIATSLYGCKDTLTKNGAFIYDETLIKDNCWAFQFGSNASYSSFQLNDYTINTIKSGGVIVSGRNLGFNLTTNAGVIPNTQNDTSFFIAKFSDGGVLKWVVQGKQSPYIMGSNFIRDIEIDEEGNIFTVGNANNLKLYANDGKVLRPDGTHVTSSLSSVSFIMKFDSNGRYLWHTKMESAQGFELELDDSVNVYVDGTLNSSSSQCKLYSTSGTFRTISGLNSTNFILKMDSSGQIRWVTNYNLPPPGGTLQRNNYLSVNGTGQIFITGSKNGRAIFRSVSGSEDSLFNWSRSIILAKYQTNGNLDWLHSIGGNMGSSKGYSITSDSQGNSYLAAAIEGPFCSLPSVNKSNDSIEIYGYSIISYNKAGDLNWAVGAKDHSSFCKEITIDEHGNIYSFGFIYGTSPILLDKISTNGKSTSLQPNSHSNLSFVMTKHTKYGELIWTTLQNGRDPVTSFGWEDFNSIAVNHKQDVYVTGTFEVASYSSTGFIVASDTLLHYSDPAVYVAKYSASSCLQSDSLVAIISSGPYCEGSVIEIPFYAPNNISFTSSNSYKLELSDSAGSFSSPIIIGTLNSTLNIDTISGIIPMGVYPNKNYKVRIVSSNPSIVGNSTFINIGVSNLTPINFNQTLCEDKQILLSPNFGYKYSWSPSKYLRDSLSKIGVSTPKNSVQYLVSVDNFCASVVDTFNLNVLHTSYDTITVNSCSQYTFPSNTKTVTVSGVYYDTLIGSNTCDSVIKINLTITPLNKTVLLNGSTLTSLQTGAIYQWLDCNNGYSTISGERNVSFNPTTNGNYAVEITYNGCKDTSDCKPVNNVSINENIEIRDIVIFPNPNLGTFTLYLGEKIVPNQIFITDINGRLIKEITPKNISQYQITFDGASGVYLLNIFTSDTQVTYKIIKN